MSISDTLKAQKYASIAEIAAAQSKLYADKLESAPDYAAQAAASANLAATSASQAESASLTAVSAANSATASAISASNSAEAAGEAAADAIQNYVDQSVRVPGSETVNPVPAAASRANAVFLWDGASQPTGKLLSEFVTLDGTGKIPVSMIPSIALTEPFVVSSQAEMLALNAQVGDIAKRTDLGYSFCLASSPPSTLANWVQLTDDVLAQLGLSSGATMVGAVDDSSNPTTVQGALNLKTSIASLAASTGATLIGATNNAGSTSTVQSVLNLKLEKTELAANDGEKFIGICPSIATLRLTEPTSNGQRITLREYTAGTGYGGGQFRAVMSASSYTDNNGTIIKTTSGNAWLRINSEVVNPLMFGAVPRIDNTTASCHTALQYAFNAAKGVVDGVGLTFNMGGEADINNASPILFKDITLNCTMPSTDAYPVIRVRNASHTVRNMSIIGNNIDGMLGINVESTANNSIVEGCSFTNLGSTAIYASASRVIARNNYTYNCGYAGTGNYRCSIWFNENEHAVMEGNTCLACTWGILTRATIGSTIGYYNTMRNNIVVSKAGTTSDCQGISASAQRGLTTSGNIVREFPNNGIDHQNCFNMTIIDNHITNCSDGVFIGDRSCGRIIISNNQMEGCNNGVRYYNPTNSVPDYQNQTFSDVQITNNIAYMSKSCGISVIMSGTTSANYLTRIDGNIVDGNGSTGQGIVLDTVTTGSACNNQVRRTAGHGINLTSCDGLRVTNNTMVDCGYGTTATYSGIMATTCARCDLTHNYAIGASMVYTVNVSGGGQNLVDFNISRSLSGATATNVTSSTGTINGTSQIKG